MINKNKKGVTLDELATMVAKGFESTASKEDIKEVNLRVDKVEQKLAKIDSRVDDIYEIVTRFEEVDILDLQHRTKILERTVKAMGKGSK